MAQTIQNMESAARFHLTQAQGNGTPGMSMTAAQPGPNSLVDKGGASKPELGDAAQMMSVANKRAQDLKQDYVTALSSGQIELTNAERKANLSQSQAEYKGMQAAEQARATQLTVMNNLGMATPNIIAMANNNLAQAANEAVATQGRIKTMFPGLV